MVSNFSFSSLNDVVLKSKAVNTGYLLYQEFLLLHTCQSVLAPLICGKAGQTSQENREHLDAVETPLEFSSLLSLGDLLCISDSVQLINEQFINK